jgi:two-component system, sensor histidine kinase LadS
MPTPFATKTNRLFRPILGWVLLCLGCFLGSAQAQGLQSLHWTMDPSAQAQVATVAALPETRWQALNGAFSRGFTPQAVWLRVRYTTAAHTPALLELEQTSLHEVDFFYPDASGAWVHRPGVSADWEHPRALDYRRPLLQLPDAPNGGTVYVRVHTQSSLTIEVRLWALSDWVRNSQRDALWWGLFFGFNLMVVVFFGLYAYWTRIKMHAVYALYMLSLLLVTFLTGGWHTHLTTWGTTSLWFALLGIVLSWVHFVAMVFDFELLNLRQTRPRLTTTVLWFTGLVGVTATIGIAAGHYRTFVPLIQLIGTGLIVLNMYLGVSELKKGNPNARLFLWAFGIFYIGVLIRYLHNFGVVEPSTLTKNSYQMAAFLHMMIMSVGIFSSYNRLQTEKNAAVALAEQEHAQRQRQGDFLGLVSHELRTPLTIVSTAADNLVRAPIAQAERDRVNKIRRATERMRTIIEGYLNAERLTQAPNAAALQTIHLNSLCKQVIHNAQERSPHPIHLHIPTDCAMTMQGDVLQIQIALDNLVANAIAHSSPGAAVEVGLWSDDQTCCVEVTNHGDPIAEQDLPHVFERFYRGHNAMQRTGSGLGLYLVHQIAGHHQGQVRAVNLPDGRCRFVLSLAKGG